MEKTDNLSSPLIVGEFYLVPCYVHSGYLKFHCSKSFITPLLNHPHNDIENGQFETHYHQDDRFIPKFGNKRVLKSGKYEILPHIRLNVRESDLVKVFPKLEYFALKCIKLEVDSITSPGFISKSKFKHNCIYKNKCPHRGYDLSNEVPVNGVITCPLHGLKFDAETKELINYPFP